MDGPAAFVGRAPPQLGQPRLPDDPRHGGLGDRDLLLAGEKIGNLCRREVSFPAQLDDPRISVGSRPGPAPAAPVGQEEGVIGFPEEGSPPSGPARPQSRQSASEGPRCGHRKGWNRGRNRVTSNLSLMILASPRHRPSIDFLQGNWGAPAPEHHIIRAKSPGFPSVFLNTLSMPRNPHVRAAVLHIIQLGWGLRLDVPRSQFRSPPRLPQQPVTS